MQVIFKVRYVNIYRKQWRPAVPKKKFHARDKNCVTCFMLICTSKNISNEDLSNIGHFLRLQQTPINPCSASVSNINDIENVVDLVAEVEISLMAGRH